MCYDPNELCLFHPSRHRPYRTTEPCVYDLLTANKRIHADPYIITAETIMIMMMIAQVVLSTFVFSTSLVAEINGTSPRRDVYPRKHIISYLYACVCVRLSHLNYSSHCGHSALLWMLVRNTRKKTGSHCFISCSINDCIQLIINHCTRYISIITMRNQV